MRKLLNCFMPLFRSDMDHNGPLPGTRALLLVGFVCVLLTGQAQPLIAKATIKGQVIDNITGEALPAANVVIQGTNFGAAADFNGFYTITNAPSGEQTLLVSYIGYESTEISVDVPESGSVTKDILLKAVAVEGEEITITAQARGQREAINQQIRADAIKNVVSSTKIHELPDASAAEALSRLPGVSLMEGDKVVIRGVESKLNQVLINGIELPSTDMEDRSTNLGFISSNLLSGIEVTKAITPDMDANTIGGVINLRLREAPSGLHFDVFTQGALNTQDRTYDNYKAWASISNRFLDDKLGVFLQGNATRFDGGQDRVGSDWEIAQDLPYGEAPYMMNSITLNDQWNVNNDRGGSLILDYKLPDGKIVLQNTIANNVSDNTAFRTIYAFNETLAEYAITRDKYKKDLMINALQAEYNFGNLNTRLSASHSSTNKATDIRYGDVGQFMSFQNTNSHPYGYDDEGNRIQFLNERRFFTIEDALDIPKDETDANNATIQGWVVARDEEFEQHLYNYTLDFTLPVAISDNIQSEFKFGGKIKTSERTNDVESYFSGSYDTDYYNATSDFFPDHPNLSPTNPVMYTDLRDPDYKRGEYFLEGEHEFKFAYDRDLMDDYMKTSIKGWTPARHMPYSERDDFSGSETFSAGYFMGNFNIGPRLTLIGGLRYEHYNMDYNANFVYCTHSVYGDGAIFDTLNTVDRNDEDIFPNFHIRYKVTDWSDIRLAYTEGISRPDYRAIMPSIYFEPGGYALAGNPKLKPARSANYDAYWSVYNNEIGLFTLGGFYKKIDNTFFQTGIFYPNLNHYDASFPGDDVWDTLGAQSPTGSQTVTTYINNPNPAHVRGLEVEWQTNFWYLPKPLNSMVLNINYTRSWSEMDYQQLRNIDSTYKDPDNPRFLKHKYITRDTARTARLLHQGNHNLNVVLGADYKDFSGRISFRMQGDVITSVGARPEEDAFTGNFYRWDFTLKQKLPFLDGLSVALNGVNVFHNPLYEYRRFRRTVDGNIKDNQTSIAYSPRIFELNLRYNF
ncbi:MAG: TonB-dependent receptor [candidate division KSB1 bacterium]|nr:TonB-dependent receptor [candidate division KSB1 bacterium]